MVVEEPIVEGILVDRFVNGHVLNIGHNCAFQDNSKEHFVNNFCAPEF